LVTVKLLAEFFDNAIPALDLQGENLLELLKQPLGLTRIVPVAFQPGHKPSLRLDALLTF
jgi:hypothetical protein